MFYSSLNLLRRMKGIKPFWWMISQPWKKRAATGLVHQLGMLTTHYERCLARSLVLCLSCLLCAFFLSDPFDESTKFQMKSKLLGEWTFYGFLDGNIFKACVTGDSSQKSFKWNHICKNLIYSFTLLPTKMIPAKHCWFELCSISYLLSSYISDPHVSSLLL